MNHASRRIVQLLLLVLGLAFVAAPADASWLTRILRHADDAPGKRAGKGVVGGFDEAGSHIKALPGPRRSRAIAVDATNVGHWRLRNADGETFTAANPEELRRGLQLLAPMRTGEVAGHIFFLTSDVVFRHRERLKELPADAEFNALFEGQVVRLVQRMIDGTEHYYLDTGGGLHLPITTREHAHEVLWQLTRPVDRSAIRVLALEPGATTLLKRTPPPSAGPSRIAVEAVDPERLPHMLSAVSGGTIVVTGRLAGPLLHYRPSSGPERTLAHGQLRADALAKDVNVIVVSSSSARQPGTRNWLWQRVDLTSQADSKTPPSISDLVRRLTGGVPVEARVTDQGAHSVSIAFFALAGGGRGWIAPVGDAWRELAPEVTGTIVATGLQLHLRNRERQKELDLRIIPGIPSGYQWGYVSFLLFGLIGMSAAGPWWRRIWPLEERSEYAGRLGYWAARILRGALYLLVFLPLVSPVSAPIAAVRWVWGWMVAIYTFITYPLRRRTA